MAIAANEFKTALSRWASGVSVVTTNDDGMLYGITVSSFSSLSLDPPLVLVCLSNSNRIVEMIDNCKQFAVSILSTEQETASNYFARPGRLPTEDFTEIEGEWTGVGVPVVKGSLAWLACRLHLQVREGDHTIVIGEVEKTGGTGEGQPLLYFDRAYRSLT